MPLADTIPRPTIAQTTLPTLTNERVILVNAHDEEVGTEEKLRAHQLKLLHRAFSVFVVNASGDVLLQRRASQKYHSAGLWSNAACGHPRPGEHTSDAARRRLREEMGIDSALTEVGAFTYCLAVTAELTEHEFDHVFLGQWDGTPIPDPSEVAAWRWCAPSALNDELAQRPESFSVWLPEAWKAVANAIPGTGVQRRSEV